MSLPLSVRGMALCLGWALLGGAAASASGQTNYYATNGTEYAIVGALPGDQVKSDAAINPSGGFVVWQDNVTDGSGWGVSATRLDSTLSASPVWSDRQVNVQSAGDQENPRVALLKNGGAVFAWQGGQSGYQHIFARFLTPTNTWMSGGDILVSASGTNLSTFYVTNTTITITTNIIHGRTTYTTNTVSTITTNTFGGSASFQINPALAVLNNSNVVVVWSSFDQAGSNSLQDVYGQILSPSGSPVGTNFLINQFTAYNQRNPTVAPLANGGFVVAWVSEQQRTTYNYSGFDNVNGTASTQVGTPSVDIYARLYNSNGVAQANEFLVDTDTKPCANPAVAASPAGGFMIVWSAKDTVVTDNSWDIYARSFSTAGTGGAVVLVNSYTFGDQYTPRISAIGSDYLVAFTSLGQDGSHEGVFGQFLRSDGSLAGGEFQVNTTTAGQQMQPAVASDGTSQFLAVWTGFTLSGMDLFAQRYLNVGALLLPIDSLYVYAPFALSNGVYQPQLEVTWPPVLGISATYEVYVDGASAPTGLTASNSWMMTAANGLTTNATHSFTVDYVTTDGRRSPVSPSASGTTWSGLSYYGIPYEWMTEFFGGYYNGSYHTNGWPAVNQPPPNSPPGSPTVLQLFLSGGVPYDPSTWLTTTLVKVGNGMRLSWNTQPGLTYQVQMTIDFVTWGNLPSPYDTPRFAPGTTDFIPVSGGGGSYYRVILLR